MARNSLVVLLLCTLQPVFPPNFAANEPAPQENATIKVDYCDAPAPDDFRVISIASGQPLWVGCRLGLEHLTL